MASKGKRQKIDWNNIKISIVPADKENPNPLNPCSHLSPKERGKEIVSIGARIWSRAMKDKLPKAKNDSNAP